MAYASISALVTLSPFFFLFFPLLMNALSPNNVTLEFNWVLSIPLWVPMDQGMEDMAKAIGILPPCPVDPSTSDWKFGNETLSR